MIDSLRAATNWTLNLNCFQGEEWTWNLKCIYCEYYYFCALVPPCIQLVPLLCLSPPPLKYPESAPAQINIIIVNVTAMILGAEGHFLEILGASPLCITTVLWEVVEMILHEVNKQLVNNRYVWLRYSKLEFVFLAGSC